MKRPWNFINVPVYSLATYNGEGQVNMNICTYVTPISMQPKLYQIGICEQTQSLFNIQDNELAILQLLHQDQFSLVRTLGQRSGTLINKQKYLAKKYLLEDWNSCQVLKNVSARMALQVLEFKLTGDHYSYLCEVVKFKTYNYDYLQLNHLKEKGIIRL